MTLYEMNARERKAAKIADHALTQWRQTLADYGVAEDRRALSSFVIEMAGANTFIRWAWATNAGQKKPSATTWLRVIEIVAHRGALAQSQPADPFAGLTEADAA